MTRRYERTLIDTCSEMSPWFECLRKDLVAQLERTMPYETGKRNLIVEFWRGPEDKALDMAGSGGHMS